MFSLSSLLCYVIGGCVLGCATDCGGVCEAWADSLCCPDEVFEDCNGGQTVGVYPFSDADYLLMSSSILFERTCRRYPGRCERTVELCLEDDCSSKCSLLCSCCEEDRIGLRCDYPILEVLEVSVGGIVVDPSVYALFDNEFLVRTDGSMWPRCTRGSDCVFSVTYVEGCVPPLELQNAASVLACELKKACNNVEGCRIPNNVRSMNRGGVNYQMNDVVGLYATGFFGIPEVDMIVSQYDCSDGVKVFHPRFSSVGRRRN